MHEADTFVALDKPDVDRLAFQHFPNLRSDDRQQLVHFQRGAENFFDVVKLGKPGDGGQRTVPLLLVRQRRHQRRRCYLRKRSESLYLMKL